MKFDVTNLNLRDVLRALVANAQPKGYGEKIYADCLDKGENVESVSDEEMDEFFSEYVSMANGSCRVVDYYKGMPIKLDLTKEGDGQITANSIGYDISHGEFEFLKAILPYFVLDEIIIIDRSEHAMADPANRNSGIDQVRLLKSFVEAARRVPYEFGYYWKLDPLHPSYAQFKI